MADFSAADWEKAEACAAHGVAVGLFSADGISGSSGAGGEPAVVGLPRRWPAVKIATATPIAPKAIRTQTHHDGPPPESVVAAVVCVSCALTEVEFVIDVVADGFVTVCVTAVPLADWVLLFSSPVALETAPVAAFAALDAALLADPDPHPLSSAVTRPSASVATTIDTRTVNLTIVRPRAVARVRAGYTASGVAAHSSCLSRPAFIARLPRMTPTRRW